METGLIIAVIQSTQAVVKLKSEKKKKSGLNGIRTHQLSYQANWELTDHVVSSLYTRRW